MSKDVTRTVAIDERLRALRMRRFLLVVEPPDGETQHRVYGQRRVTIGSNPDNDLPVDDPAVSRLHAELVVEESGYRLRDIESKNGLYIGDMRVRDVYLQHGTRFEIGETSIRFETTDDEVEVILSRRRRFGKLVGASTAMQEIFGLFERVSPTDATVLLEGRTGTGKELAAEAIHGQSARRTGPFVVFDCSAVSGDETEAELFGAEATPGRPARPGAFREAEGGTLYIDEIDALPLETQARLARVLEHREVRPVGSRAAVPIDARLLVSTTRPLSAEVQAQTFREDLLYLLAVVHVVIPPLRDRPEDIPLLVEHFLQRARERSGNDTLNVTYATMERLRHHAWPGNVRELENFIARAVALADGTGSPETRFLDPGAPSVSGSNNEETALSFLSGVDADVSMPFKDAKARLIEAFERSYWLRLLERTGGNVSQAARVAGVHRKSLEYTLKKLDIDRHELKGDD